MGNGDLRLILLKLLAEEPRHGYDLIRAVEALTGGAYAPSPGLIYPTLTMLKDMGAITEAEAGPDSQRKVFSVTPQGQALLTENATVVAALMERLSAAGQARGRFDPAPVKRAMENLRTALFARLGGEVDRELVLKVAAVLDEATQRIERL